MNQLYLHQKIVKTLLNVAIVFLLTLVLPTPGYSQGFLHANGKYIYDGNGNEVILRGIGTGNWMIQEGYMMQSSDVAGTMHEFRNKLVQTIGETKTDSFYNAWLAYHMTRTDIDSMAAWGFNSVRVALHYKWFTLPIEDEPVNGDNTWLDKGFIVIDSLLSWCSENHMFLILDMHGTPGGQGKDANISDYDSSKPSLWESQQNQDKLVALWKKLAERYANESWIGGYDLINETNWTFSDANYSPLWNLFKEITTAIRTVDQNHIIILEGNWFANDYTGMPAVWDNNLVCSFHKYWTYNTPNSLDWMINLRNQKNVPIWLGESGENSNTWFTNLIALSESEHIGWSWWPVKKPGVNNIMRSTVNADYTKLINYWKGSGPAPTEDAAFQAVLQFAENHKFENCIIQRDVIDAMIRQPFSTETKPYKMVHTGETVFATDYDLGRNNYAYFDTDTADYHGSTDTYISWNAGYSYRNDGVDIEVCTDTSSNNGYNVGWVADDEWMQYTLLSDSTAAYKLDLRMASTSSNTRVLVEVDNVPASSIISIPSTGGWQKWVTTTVDNVIVPKGEHKIKIKFVTGGANFNYFKLYSPTSVDDIDFSFTSAQTSTDGTRIFVTLNKEITSEASVIALTDFIVLASDTERQVSSVTINQENPKMLELTLTNKVYFNNIITLSYSGTTITSGTQTLSPFSNQPVINTMPDRHLIPGKIQAEDFYLNKGMVVETCSDLGGGSDMGYANNGDYLDYLVQVSNTGDYTVNYRIACTSSNRQIILKIGDGTTFGNLDTVTFTSTGDWQTWKTFTGKTHLTEGEYILRMYVRAAEFNLNWIEFKFATGIESKAVNNEFTLYPNPASQTISLFLNEPELSNSKIEIYSSAGILVKTDTIGKGYQVISISDLPNGMYIVKVIGTCQVATGNFIKN